LSNLSTPPESPTQLRPADKQFECEVRASGRAGAWIRLCGELDIATAPQFEQAVQDSLSSALLVIIDLRELTFMDSTGVHVIVQADARGRRSGRRLVLVRGPAQIDRMFKLVGLSDRLGIVDLS
jgi:anti-sigma B factor antagonist